MDMQTGVSLVAETTNGCFFGAEACGGAGTVYTLPSSPTLPPFVLFGRSECDSVGRAVWEEQCGKSSVGRAMPTLVTESNGHTGDTLRTPMQTLNSLILQRCCVGIGEYACGGQGRVSGTRWPLEHFACHAGCGSCVWQHMRLVPSLAP